MQTKYHTTNSKTDPRETKFHIERDGVEVAVYIIYDLCTDNRLAYSIFNEKTPSKPQYLYDASFIVAQQACVKDFFNN